MQPVYLAASAVNTLVRALPAGTAYFIGVVLITLCTGQLVHPQGSLARAALPYVVHLRWGWHRVERAMERGKVSLDALFDRAFTWCLECLPVEPVRLGQERGPSLPSTPRPWHGCGPTRSGARGWAKATALGLSGRCKPTSSPRSRSWS